MKPNDVDISLINCTVNRVRLLCKRNHIQARKLNLDFYQFEVDRGKVREGICLYYTESASRVQGDNETWFSKELSPISWKMPSWQEKLPAYLKLQMGEKGWYKEEHHHV